MKSREPFSGLVRELPGAEKPNGKIDPTKLVPLTARELRQLLTSRQYREYRKLRSIPR